MTPMTPSSQVIRLYAKALSGVTYPYKLSSVSEDFRAGLELGFTEPMRAIYEANRLRLAGESSPRDCAEAVTRILQNA